MGSGRADFDSADAPASSVLDRSVVRALLDDLGPENAQEICKVYVRDAQMRADGLQAALDAGDASAAARAAHGLKSGSGFVGATAVYDLSAEIERTARSNELGYARTHMADLRAALERTASGLVELVGHLSDPS